MKSSLLSLLALILLCLTTEASAAGTDTPIGDVSGKTIYRSAIEGKAGSELESAMRRLFVDVAISEHLRTHKKELEPSEADIALVSSQIKASMMQDPALARMQRMDDAKARSLAGILLTNIYIQRHIYQRFGGGRLLFQQAGVEAFDATRVMIEEFESQGKIKIFDPVLRAPMYAYWNRNNGVFITDKADIEAALDPTRLIAK